MYLIINGIDFYQSNYVRDYYRSFGFNITYKFGKLKDEIKSIRRKIENRDLANNIRLTRASKEMISYA